MNRPTIAQQITFIYSEELKKTAQFYEQIMSLTLWRDQGSCRIYQLTSDSFLGICQVNEQSKGKAASGQQSSIIITLVTPEVDQWYEYLQAKGVVFEKPPEVNTQYKIYHCFLRDPNGYLIEIQQFLD